VRCVPSQDKLTDGIGGTLVRCELGKGIMTTFLCQGGHERCSKRLKQWVGVLSH
jgi:hypothetical protein